MREISVKKITEIVAELSVRANLSLRKDILMALKKALLSEKSASARDIIRILIENARIAEKDKIPICQDTGFAEVFCRIGRDTCIKGDPAKAINKGIRLGYEKAFLRKSVVLDPIIRKNTNTNTPCVIHYDLVRGGKIEITVLAKGFGSENASALKMLKPNDSEESIVDFVLDTVIKAGSQACPPLVIGIGLGGTLDKSALLATQAILYPISRKNPKRHLARIEEIIFKRVNLTGIGPAGLGGSTTCLGVNILSFPTHIAGLPLCVKISCHATRSATGII